MWSCDTPKCDVQGHWGFSYSLSMSQAGGVPGFGSAPSALLYLSGSPGLESASLRWTQRQTSYGQLCVGAAQRKRMGGAWVHVCGWGVGSRMVRGFMCVFAAGSQRGQRLSQRVWWKSTSCVRSHDRSQEGTSSNTTLFYEIFILSYHNLPYLTLPYFTPPSSSICRCSHWKTPECQSRWLNRWVQHVLNHLLMLHLLLFLHKNHQS